MNIQINYDVIAVFLCIFLHKKIINNSTRNQEIIVTLMKVDDCHLVESR